MSTSSVRTAQILQSPTGGRKALAGRANPVTPLADADLLGFGPSDLSSIGQTFRDIAAVTVEDGILFDPARLGVKSEQ